ncbi:CO2 hydration protein [Leptolyngbya sp. NIES-2104]|uniref:CO2 hydration protein n=1 Tax=Leptolyngbya sp. NIES-2104 TaxID=1552121 RepID=UPI0006EC9026|nr:CO2 hydration protein [Leptolyngbya sp. NIES-2104]GAP95769.1 low-affinity CO2 hydration protein CphX [Leptolyngbya sp. NIES-2104]
MVAAPSKSTHPLAEIVDRIESGGALLPESPINLIEVVGVLKSYGVVLDAYSRNLKFIADHQFLVLFPFFKYFDGEITTKKLLKHWWHDRINYEFSEYCMKAMMWHGGGGLDTYLDSPEFVELAQEAIQAKIKGNFFISNLSKIFPNFLLEQIRMSCYYSAIGQFWTVMSEMFLELSDRYDNGEIKTIQDVVEHVKSGLVNNAALPITYGVKIGDRTYDIIPESAGLQFLMDTAVPYVEAVFFKSFPFMGTVSYNAQARQIPLEQERFSYGALYADPLPVGGGGIPPTLLMQDMMHYIPEYLHELYRESPRGENDIRVKICISFQKSMFCVTTAAILGLAPYAIETQNPKEQAENRKYLEGWMDKLMESRLISFQSCDV